MCDLHGPQQRTFRAAVKASTPRRPMPGRRLGVNVVFS
ncbi:hypothetical protein GuangZ0019_3914 [Mycobacterium tuberculosis GuangZ0019]|nr:hypothetical protein Mb1595_p1236 [Mycobacterium tuberculosis variant bovis]ALA77537.1 Uncharacterized protein BCGR_1220 [Mycobacterium tuberculosis variant bovis BCG]AOZ42220.1 hypothetical protein BTB1458_1216 [Mycobacterium tuberculosis]EQM16843.1 hypothetical protein GuangZ0019_3914 [Mycobacterium tuberculosis GuangZ0019]BAQ05037.1 hypothetical protein KURONO_1231 [Mycobacterium tuberculosis str. Kurono]